MSLGSIRLNARDALAQDRHPASSTAAYLGSFLPCRCQSQLGFRRKQTGSGHRPQGSRSYARPCFCHQRDRQGQHVLHHPAGGNGDSLTVESPAFSYQQEVVPSGRSCGVLVSDFLDLAIYQLNPFPSPPCDLQVVGHYDEHDLLFVMNILKQCDDIIRCCYIKVSCRFVC